jgi:uncharacterized protein
VKLFRIAQKYRRCKLLYRPVGKSDFQVSALGFGTMRLPTRSADNKDVNEELAIAMIRYAIDQGVNYVDSAYPYHGGISEVVTGKALRDGYRGKVRLATKLPCWLVKEQGDFDRYLDEQLERLQTDHLDYYLLHSMKDYVWEQMKSMRVLDWAEKRMADGKFGRLGFSFHDRFEVFQQMLNDYPGWQVAQIYLNFMTLRAGGGAGWFAPGARPRYSHCNHGTYLGRTAHQKPAIGPYRGL